MRYLNGVPTDPSQRKRHKTKKSNGGRKGKRRQKVEQAVLDSVRLDQELIAELQRDRLRCSWEKEMRHPGELDQREVNK